MPLIATQPVPWWHKPDINRKTVVCAGQVIQVSPGGLPPLPDARNGGHVRWGIVFAEPLLDYHGNKIVIDEAFVAEVVSDFRRMTKDGYAPPVLREHIRTGEREGHVLELRGWRDPGDGKLKVIAASEYLDRDAEQLIESGRWYYLSARLDTITNESGDKFRTLTELSLVSAPYHKQLTKGAHILAENIKLAFIKRSSDGTKWNVHQGNNGELLSSFEKKEDAEKEVDRLHRENNPERANRGKNAKKDFDKRERAQMQEGEGMPFWVEEDGRVNVRDGSGPPWMLLASLENEQEAGAVVEALSAVRGEDVPNMEEMDAARASYLEWKASQPEGDAEMQDGEGDEPDAEMQDGEPPGEQEEEEDEATTTETSEAKEPATLSELRAELVKERELNNKREAENKALREGLQKAAFRHGFPSGGTITLSESLIDAMWEVSRKAPDAFQTLRAAIRETPSITATEGSAQEQMDANAAAMLAELGKSPWVTSVTSGQAPPPTGDTFEELSARATANAKKNGTKWDEEFSKLRFGRVV